MKIIKLYSENNRMWINFKNYNDATDFIDENMLNYKLEKYNAVVIDYGTMNISFKFLTEEDMTKFILEFS